MDNLIDALQQAERLMADAGAASSDPILAKEQLKEQRLLNDEVVSYKARSRDVIAAAKRLQNSFSGEDADKIRTTIEVRLKRFFIRFWKNVGQYFLLF